MTRLEVIRTAPEGSAARLWRAVAALAEAPPSAEDAKRRPVVAGLAENLVFEFDEAYTAFVESFQVLPTESQMLALQAVDTQVSAMVRAREASLWTEQARREDEAWREVRGLARTVLEAFEWPGL